MCEWEQCGNGTQNVRERERERQLPFAVEKAQRKQKLCWHFSRGGSNRCPPGAIIWGIVLPCRALPSGAMPDIAFACSCHTPCAPFVVPVFHARAARIKDNTRTQSRAIVHAKLGSNNAILQQCVNCLPPGHYFTLASHLLVYPIALFLLVPFHHTLLLLLLSPSSVFLNHLLSRRSSAGLLLH